MKNRILACITLIVISGNLFGQQIKQPLMLWYDKPASKWLEALPIGNGNLGGMLFGGVEQEHIQFNQQSLITGTTSTVGFYQPFGDVFIDFPAIKADNYRRALDISQSIQQVQYTANGIQYTREAFVSYPDKVLVYRITANKTSSVTAKIRLTDAHHAKIQVVKNKITATGKLAENQMEYESQLLVKTLVAVCHLILSGISIKNADEIIVFLSAGTNFLNNHRKNFVGDHPHNALSKMIAQASAKTFQQLRKTILQIIKAYLIE